MQRKYPAEPLEIHSTTSATGRRTCLSDSPATTISVRRITASKPELPTQRNTSSKAAPKRAKKTTTTRLRPEEGPRSGTPKLGSVIQVTKNFCPISLGNRVPAATSSQLFPEGKSPITGRAQPGSVSDTTTLRGVSGTTHPGITGTDPDSVSGTTHPGITGTDPDSVTGTTTPRKKHSLAATRATPGTSSGRTSTVTGRAARSVARRRTSHKSTRKAAPTIQATSQPPARPSPESSSYEFWSDSSEDELLAALQLPSLKEELRGTHPARRYRRTYEKFMREYSGPSPTPSVQFYTTFAPKHTSEDS